MTAYVPFLDDPRYLAQVAGQRFVVLRPTGSLPLAFRPVQDILKQRLAGTSALCPAQPHVTLAGFKAGTSNGSVLDIVAEWARHTAPLRLTVEGTAAFPPPFQALFVQLQKTAELVEALSRLRNLATTRNLELVTVTPPDRWIFHMSLANCRGLSAEAWTEVRTLAEQLDAGTGAHCLVQEVEIVVFEGGREESGGVVPLSMASTARTPQAAV